MTLALVHHMYNLPEGQTRKSIFLLNLAKVKKVKKVKKCWNNFLFSLDWRNTMSRIKPDLLVALFVYTDWSQMNVWKIICLNFKNPGLSGIRTNDLCDTGAVLNQLSYQASWELVTLWVRNIPVEKIHNCLSCVYNCNDQFSYLSPQFKYTIFHLFICNPGCDLLHGIFVFPRLRSWVLLF